MRECVTFLKMSLLVGFFKASRMLRVLGFGHTDRIEVWRDACIRKDEQGDPDAQHDRSRVLQRGIPPSDDQDAQRLATGGGGESWLALVSFALWVRAGDFASRHAAGSRS